MKAFAYARFSSDNQREESIDAQLRAIRDYARTYGIEIVREFTDEARSATTDKRPGFLAMFASDLKSVDLVIVHKLDRFSRDRYDSAFYKRELKKKGVRLVSVLEHLDDSPESVILESVIEGMNEYYSRNLARETLKGMRENAYKCKHTGGQPPLGYDVIDGYYKINPQEAEIVRRIFGMYADGHKYSEIVQSLGNARTKWGFPFTNTSLNSILNNEKYIGTFTFGRQHKKSHNSHAPADDEIIRVPNGIPRIIDDDTWTICQQRIRSKKRNSASTAKRIYILSGKLICDCGAVMNGASSVNSKGSYRYYRCPVCRHSVTAGDIEQEVLDRISSHLHFTMDEAERLHDMMISDQKKKRESETAKELQDVQRKIKNFVQAIEDGVPFSQIADEMNRLADRERELQNRLVLLDDVPPVETIMMFLQSVSDLKRIPQLEQKSLINRLVEKIITVGTQFQIEFRLPKVAGDGTALWTRFSLLV